jgi:cytochrome c biogenesis protein CcmG, thiol:disulfide interchange protein DsbE
MRRRGCPGVLAVAVVVVVTSACGGPPDVGPPEQGSVEPAQVNGLARDIEPCPEPEEPDDASEGERLPALELPCLGTGASVVDLAEPTGRPTLVNLWATWCGPCRKEMPVLQDAYEAHAGEVLFLGVDTLDDPRRAVAFLREVGATYPQVVDGDGQIMDGLRIRGLPVTVMLDASGTIVDRHVGALDRDRVEELIGEVEE